MTDQPSPPAAPARVLHVGCGPYSPQKLHRLFRGADWREVRLDVDPDVAPDIVSSIAGMADAVADASHQAIWCSHVLEHLFDHEVAPALAEFHRVLAPGGFALITCPDLERIARMIVEVGADAVAYEAPAGPITPIDMLFGLRPAIARGRTFMAHRTGFTADRLGRALAGAGFAEVRVAGVRLDLWAVAVKGASLPADLEARLAVMGLDLAVQGA